MGAARWQRRRVGRVAWQRKGGSAALAQAGAKLTEQIAHRAIGDAEARGDVGHRLLLEEDGTDDFVAKMLRGLRIGEEQAWVVHDRASEFVIELFVPTLGKGYP